VKPSGSTTGEWGKLLSRAGRQIKTPDAALWRQSKSEGFKGMSSVTWPLLRIVLSYRLLSCTPLGFRPYFKCTVPWCRFLHCMRLCLGKKKKFVYQFATYCYWNLHASIYKLAALIANWWSFLLEVQSLDGLYRSFMWSILKKERLTQKKNI
jgi:hypothetical protein